MLRWFLLELQAELPVLSLLQGKVSITLGQMSHDGPGAQNIEHEVSTSQTLQPFLNKCPPCV